MTNNDQPRIFWDQVYDSGRQLNRYPFHTVVSIVMRYFSSVPDRSRINILEVGFGAGNNLWCIAREGFSVTGIEHSAAAVNYAKKRFQEDGLVGNLVLGDFSSLPFDPDSFDLVIDRGSLTCLNHQAYSEAVTGVQRVLKKGGIFYSEVYSDRSSFRGNLLSAGQVKSNSGPFAPYGDVGFFNRFTIENNFSKEWGLRGLQHSEVIDYFSSPFEIVASWMITAEKL